MQFSTRTLALLLAAIPLPLLAQASPKAGPATAATQKLDSSFARLPLAFEPNRGQAPGNVQFVSHTPTANLFLSGPDAYLETVQYRHGDHPSDVRVAGEQTVRMHLLGTRPNAPAMTEEPLQGTANYMTGSDRSKWQTGVPTYGRITMAGVYPGIDLTYYGTNGKLEYDFRIAPQADVTQIRLSFEGAKASLESGELALATGGPAIRFHQPVAYQQIAGTRHPVDSSFLISPKGEVSFRLGSYDHSQPLVIDPQVVYEAELGTGQNNNITNKMVVDNSGALYFVGTTQSSYFPVTPGAFQATCGPAEGIAASNGVVYCNGPSGTANGLSAAYISKISADGSTLLYSTYLSGHLGGESGAGIAVDSAGNAYVLGNTSSDDFPVTSNAFQTTCLPAQPPGFESMYVPPTSQCNNFADGGGTEYTINGPVLFYSKLNPTGTQLLYSSFLGGSFGVYAYDTALDNNGNWYLFGQTLLDSSPDLYGSGGGNVQFTGFTSSGYQTIYPGTTRGDVGVFLSKFSSDGTTLEYGTWYGDLAADISVFPESFAVGQNGIVYVGGTTQAVGLPTTSGVLQASCTPQSSTPSLCLKYYDYVAEFDTTKSGAASLAAATYIGGTTAQGSNIPNDEIFSMKADVSNNIYFTGYSYDLDFPTTSGTYSSACPNERNDACNAAVVIKMPPGLAKETWGTWVGNTAGFYGVTGNSLGIDAAGKVFVMGTATYGTGFPCVNCFPQYTNTSIIFFELSPDATDLLWATFFGNSADNTGLSTNEPFGLAVSANDNVYWFGSTNDAVSGATPGAYQTLASAYGSQHTIFGEISSPTLANSTTAVTLSGSSVQTSGSVTVTVKVTGTGGTPTGTASVYLDGLLAGTVGLTNGKATATAPLANVAKGAHKIGAIYNGNSTYGSSVAIANLTVTPFATTTTVSASPTTVYVGQSITLTATAKRTGVSGTPTGSVTFYASGTEIASAALNGSGVAKLTASTAGFPAGTYKVTAVYGGDSYDATSTSASTSVTLQALNGTTTTLTASPNPVTRPAVETLTATVARKAGGAAGTPTGSVTFTIGTTLLGKITVNGSGVATLSAPTNGQPAGNFPVVAKYSGDAEDSTSTSSAVTVVVK